MAPGDAEPFVSTARLPAGADVERWVGEAHARFRTVTDGAPSTVYPTLAEVTAGLPGEVCHATPAVMLTAGSAELRGANRADP